MLVESFSHVLNPSGALPAFLAPSAGVGLRAVSYLPFKNSLISQAGGVVGVSALVVVVYEVFKRSLDYLLADFFKQHTKIKIVAKILLYSSAQLVGVASGAMMGLSFSQSWLIAGSSGIALVIKEILMQFDNKAEMRSTEGRHTTMVSEAVLPAGLTAEVTSSPIVESDGTEVPDVIIKEEAPDTHASQIQEQIKQEMPIAKMIGDVDLEALMKRFKTKSALYSDESKIVGRFPVETSYTRGKRKTMEDAHHTEKLLLENGLEASYFNICDGHGGPFVARYIRNNLPQVVKNVMNEVISERGDIHDPDDLALLSKQMKIGFKNLNNQLARKFPYQSLNCGSTALVAVTYRDFIFVFNVGDCRATIKTSEGAKDLSEDAKLTNEKFAKGVRKRGGDILPDEEGVLRVGHINIARSFGDFSSRGVCAEPKMEWCKINPEHQILILACDGIWDVLSSLEALSFIEFATAHGKTVREATSELIQKALDEGSTDNCTAMVVDLRVA